MTDTFPARSDDIAWDAALVHGVAAEVIAAIDPQRACMNCNQKLSAHVGVRVVVPNDADPETPRIFGNDDCAKRWHAGSSQRVHMLPRRRVLPATEEQQLARESREAFADRDLRKGRLGPIRVRWVAGERVESGLMDTGSALCAKPSDSVGVGSVHQGRRTTDG